MIEQQMIVVGPANANTFVWQCMITGNKGTNAQSELTFQIELVFCLFYKVLLLLKCRP